MRYTVLSDKIRAALADVSYTNSVYMGDVYDIWNNAEVRYVSACFDIVESPYADNVNTYTVRVYVADRLQEAEANITQALDASEAVFKHAIAYMRNQTGVLDVRCGSLMPFVQKFADNLAGYYADITIDVVNEINNC